MTATPVMRASKLTTVAFDLYGTLIHHKDDRQTYQRLFDALSVDKKKAKTLALTESFPDLASFVHRLRPESTLDLRPFEDDLAREIASTRTYDDTHRTLATLRSKGIRLGVISNLATPYARPFFTLGIDKLVDIHVFSCEVGLKKPDRAIYAHLLTLAKARSDQALMIGDSMPCDVVGPRCAGLRAVHLNRDGPYNAGSVTTLTDIIDYCR